MSRAKLFFSSFITLEIRIINEKMDKVRYENWAILFFAFACVFGWK
jgi:hypothetical protein